MLKYVRCLIIFLIFSNQRYEPCLVTGAISDVFVISISCGGYHTMAVDRQGQLWIWGKADARLGLGSLGSSNSDLGIEVEQSNSIKLPMMHTVLKTKGCKSISNAKERHANEAL